MKLTRICSEFSYGDWIIHKFGVDKDGNPTKRELNFRDYFYFREDQIGNLTPYDKIGFADDVVYKSIYGDDVRKVEYTSIKERNRIDDVFPTYTYELDVKPEFKHLMEARSTEWADASERHILYFDIETWSDRHDHATAQDPHAAITAIQGYSSKDNKIYIFTWHEEETANLVNPKVMEKGNNIFIFCKDEEDVINSFITFLHEYDVDIITGWWSSGFDLPYTINRCQRLNIDFNKLSPVDQVTHYQKGNEWKTFISGLDHIDLMLAVEDLNVGLSNNKLDTAAKEILGDPNKGKVTEATYDDWKDNYSGFLKYCIRDVEILYEIDQALGIFDLYCTVQKLTNITQLSDVNYKMTIVDKYILSECRDEFIFPTRRTQERQEYMGATVLEPTPGLYKDVGVVDYASLYPTSVMSFNLSPETFICSDKTAEERGLDIKDVIKRLDEKGVPYVDTDFNEELFGTRYLFYGHKKKVGLLPRILKKMYNERRAIKKEMKTEEDPVHHNALDKHQHAFKIILNSAYGAFGNCYFRLYKPEVADSITFFARQALGFAIHSLEECGYGIVYGDTDSVFFLQNDKTNDEINDWVDEFNNRVLPEFFVGKYNGGAIDEYQMMEIEYEKDLERIYFGGKTAKGVTTGNKKRYYGIIRKVPEGKDNKYIRGLNIIRKDAPTFLKGKLNEFSEKAVMGTLTVKDLTLLRETIEDVPYSELGISKKFGKRFELYVKMQPQHVKAAKFANEHLGTNIGHMDIPYMFYMISHVEDDLPKGKRSKAICLNEEDLHFLDDKKDVFELDYNTFFQKQVIDQLKEFEYIDSLKETLKEYKGSLK